MVETSYVNVTYINMTKNYGPLQVTRALRSFHGWIIFETRHSGATNFSYNRSWAEFSSGFGLPTDGNFYLGNEALSQLTSASPHSLRVEISVNGTWHSAEYFRVKVDDSSLGYALHVAGYSGDAGDSLSSADGMRFTTYDAPTPSRCNVTMSGWWYDPCATTSTSNLHNPFNLAGQRGAWWATLPPSSSGVTITYIRMMIRAIGD